MPSASSPVIIAACFLNLSVNPVHPRGKALPHHRSLPVRIGRGLGLVLGALLGLVLCVLLVFRFVNPPTTAFMVGHQLSDSRQPVRQQWVPLADMSPWLPLAVVASEDQRFPTTGAWILMPLVRRWRSSAVAAACGVPVPSPSRPPRTCSCGAGAASRARPWRPGLPWLWN